MNIKISSVVGDGIKYGIGSILQRLIGLLLVPIYTRIFIPADYGVMSVIFSFNSLLLTFLTMGLDVAFFRYYHEYNDKEKVILISSILFLRLFVSLVICLILGLTSVQLSTILLNDNQYYPLILLSLASIFFSMIWNLTIDIFRIKQRIIAYNCLQIVGLLLQTTLSIILVVFLNKGLFGLFISYFINNFIVGLISFWMIRKYIVLKIDINILKKIVTFGLGLIPGNFTDWITSSSDRILLSRYTQLSDVGIYNMSKQIASIVFFFTTAFRMAWAPIAYRDFRNDDAPDFFKKIGKYYVLFLNSVVIGCSLFSSDLLHIFTPEPYHRAYFFVPILAYGLMFSGLDSMFGDGLSFSNKTQYRSISSISGAILNLGLNFLFIPKFQILGASITALIGYFTSLSLAYYLAIKFYPRIRFNFIRALLIWTYFAIFIVIGLFMDREYSLFNVVYKLIIFFIAICGSVAIFLSKEVKQILNRKVIYNNKL